MRIKVLILSIFTIACLISSFTPVLAANDGPVAIYNITDLQNIQSSPGGSYKLMNDIVCSGVDFQPIMGFTGTFDGNGYSLKDLTVTAGKYQDAGLFDYASGATIENLNVVNADFTGSLSGLVAYDDGCTIENCSISGTVSGNYAAGGIAGIAGSGSITGCASTCTINGSSNGGGITGFGGGAVISLCRFTGTVDSAGSAGGIAGFLSSGSITQCSATGSINGAVQAGGITGYNGDSISDSYFIGDIAGSDGAGTTGGLAGYNSGTIDECYSIPSMATGGMSGGLAGYNYSSISNSYAGVATGTNLKLVGSGNVHTDYFSLSGKTQASFYIQSGFGSMTRCALLSPAGMQAQSTYVDWDFTNVWQMSSGVNDGYPVLRQQQ